MSLNSWMTYLFLYFPENKLEYIPAVFELIGAVALCFIVFFFVRRLARKQQAEALKLEKKLLDKKQEELQRH